MISRIGIFVAIAGFVLCASAAEPHKPISKDPASQQLLKDLEQSKASISFDPKTGYTRFISLPAASANARAINAKSDISEQTATSLLDNYAGLYGVISPRQNLALTKSFQRSGYSAYRYQQEHMGIPVIGGELIVSLHASNASAILGKTSAAKPSNLKPELEGDAAKNIARTTIAKWYDINANELQTSEPELAIYDPSLTTPSDFPASLVWKLEVSGQDANYRPIRELLFVNAILGNIQEHIDLVHRAKNRLTYDMDTVPNQNNLPGILVCDEADGDDCTNGANTDADQAHLYAGLTYDFYANVHSRDSIDGAGMAIISSVHHNGACQNASWDGTQMRYCDDFAVDDVVGHELTHGVTQHSSNLLYYYQSGAINESFSDIWGEFIDLSNSGDDAADDMNNPWQMGEAIPGIGTIRSLSNPPAFGDPDKMTSMLYVTGNGDAGGVHSNSGIGNKAAYLLAAGDTFNGFTVSAIGIEKTARIFYEAQTNLLISSSDYLDLYSALPLACQNLIGSNGIVMQDCTQVEAAVNATEMNQEPVNDFTPTAAICESGLPKTSFFDDFEAGAANWVRDGNGGMYDWFESNQAIVVNSGLGPYAISGVNGLFGYTEISVTEKYAQTNFTVPTNGFLHFFHAFGFETGVGVNADGGVIEYSTDNGTTWLDAGTLIDSGQSYSGVINSASNPLVGRNAFTQFSHGYVSTRVDLSSLVGRNILFRWLIATNLGGQDRGWYLDDVHVYNCNLAAPSVTNSSVTVAPGASKDGTFQASDSDGDSLTFSIVNSGTQGTATLQNATTGSFTYIANSNAAGTDTITFTVSDGVAGRDAVSGTVSVTFQAGSSGGGNTGNNPVGSGGGGSSLGWFSLLLLPLLWFRRRVFIFT